MRPEYTPKAVARFWSHVDRAGDCWPWTLRLERDGYARVRIATINRSAHRVAYELTHGAIPDGVKVLHKCDNRACCRPDHLFLGSNADNTHDMMAKGRHAHGHKTPWAKLTEQDVRDMRHRRAGGALLRELAGEFGVHIATAYNVVIRKTWRHVP